MTTTWLGTPAFPKAAHTALKNTQLRRNLRRATSTIRARRAAVVGEMPDWEELREAARAIKERTMRYLDRYLEQLEESVTARGGTVHWARDAGEACAVVVDLVKAAGATEVVKVKSLLTDEIHLNAGLARRGITAYETDLAELIVQLGDDRPSHILVPAIHRNRSEIRDIFLRQMPSAPADLSDDPAALAEAARRHLREKFLSAKVAVCGANFLVADTGTVCVVESEGNGRMCLTLPETLIAVAGIEKVVPTWQDLEVFLQVLPRSSTGERMNPYTSLWSGVTPGDGPSRFHLVLVDNGRTDVLADPTGRQALHCIRCSACLNVCPVYERVGGHAYGSVYPGPIGAILTPQMSGTAREHGDPDSLPFASSLCGACYDACPVKINIPEVLVHLRSRGVDRRRSRWKPQPEARAMRWLARVFADERRFERAQRLARVSSGLFARDGTIPRLPFALGAWTDARDAPALPEETFREWWRRTRTPAEAPKARSDQAGGEPAGAGQAGRSTRSARSTGSAPSERSGPQIENWMAELRDGDTAVDLFRPANPQAGRPGAAGGGDPEPAP